METTFRTRDLDSETVYSFKYNNLSEDEIKAIEKLSEFSSCCRLRYKFVLTTIDKYKSVIDFYKSAEINRAAIKSLKEKGIITQIDNGYSYKHGVMFQFSEDCGIQRISSKRQVLIEKSEPEKDEEDARWDFDFKDIDDFFDPE